MLKSVNLRDHMLLHPVKVKSDDNLLEAMQIIISNKISGVCVVDTEENLVGVLSELDCLRGALSAIYNESGIGIVGEYMASENLVVAHPDEDIIDVAQDMLLKKMRRRPVVEDGKLVGQITCRTLLNAVKNFRS